MILTWWLFLKFRAFVGLPVAGVCREHLARAADSLRYRDKKEEVRWTEPDNYHVTLAFLADIHVADADRLMTLLRAEVEACQTFTVAFSHLGYFPANARPHMVLAHLEQTPQLVALHQRVLRAVRDCGLHVEKRSFLPHVTLGRLRGRRSPWLEVPPEPLALALEVRCLHLYRSDRDHNGARYRVIHSAGLSEASR